MDEEELREWWALSPAKRFGKPSTEAMPVISAEVARMLRQEEDRERELDRQHWAPLKEELER